MTSLREVVKYLQEIAPKELTFGGYESRVEIGAQSEKEMEKTTINRILIATYPSGRIVTKATQEKTNLLITHWPLFPYSFDRLSGLDLIRVRLLSKNYISSYVLGSSFIAARDGIADALVNYLKLEKISDFRVVGDYTDYVPVGRICKPEKVMNHSRFVNYIVEKMGINSVRFAGDLDMEVQSVLIYPGFSLDLPEVLDAKQYNIETILTGEITPEVRLLAHEEGLNTLELGAFTTEDPGMERLRHQMSLEFPKQKIEFEKSTDYSQVLS